MSGVWRRGEFGKGATTILAAATRLETCLERPFTQTIARNDRTPTSGIWIALKIHIERSLGEVAEELPGQVRGNSGKSRDFPEARRSLTPSQRREEPGMSREFCRDVPDPCGCSKSLCQKITNGKNTQRKSA